MESFHLIELSDEKLMAKQRVYVHCFLGERGGSSPGGSIT
jgi:hypothetical protein